MLRTFALVGTREQWRDAVHRSTHVDESGRVVLDWRESPSAAAAEPETILERPEGLAFDAGCRLLRTVAAEGRIERWRWDAGATGTRPVAFDLFHAPPPAAGGDFSPREPVPALRDPRGLAVDADQRLYVAETGASRLLVHDLATGALLRRIETGSARPLDVAVAGERVLALLDDGALLEVSAHGALRRLPVEPPLVGAARIAASECGCTLAVLTAAGTRHAKVVFLEPAPAGPGLRVRRRLRAPCGRAMAIAGGELVVARGAGESFRRYDLETRRRKAPLRARGYDGGGIVRTPEGRIGYWTAEGPLHPIVEPVRYASRGEVTTVALDGGEFQRVWGRLFLQACVPRGTTLRVSARTSDEEDESAALPLAPEPGRVLERPTGSEIPWANLEPAEGGERTFEAPIFAPPGRYLWLTVELAGSTRATPALRAVRVEVPAHDLLRRLPRVLSRDARAGDFLRRYLSTLDGLLLELEARSALRHVLLDPGAAPDDALPWLAGFVGLLLDERWSERAKRTAIAEAAWLFRFRGTVPGLRRFLEIGMEAPVILIEKFKLRGQGAALLGDTGPAFTTSVLGGGFRVGGKVGATDEPTPLEGTLDDAFRTHAHRFTVIVAASLDRDRLGVAHWILDLHRPAHTVYDLCTVDAGMRVGRGLHLGLSSVIGRTASFTPLRVGTTEAGTWASTLGRGAVLGVAGRGIRASGARLGLGTEVG